LPAKRDFLQANPVTFFHSASSISVKLFTQSKLHYQPLTGGKNHDNTGSKNHFFTQ
jgi:hypothetical protein